MKTHNPLLILLPIAAAGLTSCTSVKTETNTAVKAEYGVPGGQVVQTSQVTATVTAIDSAKRKLTLVTPAGERTTVKAGPEVVNFPQIRIGDQLKVTLTEEILIRMAKPGEKTKDDAAALVGLAPVGAKPGALMAETRQVTATVTAIDLSKQKATLQFPDGSSKTFPVREDVDLSKRSVGEKVVVRSTEVFAIRIEKP